VELAISSHDDAQFGAVAEASPRSSVLNGTTGRRFESLESASASTLASYLSGEHTQTIAVVLSHLPPARAAAVLAELPANVQTATMERLANLGDTDSELVTVLEHELAEWVRKRTSDVEGRSRRRDTMSSILAAADSKTRSIIIANLKHRKDEERDVRGPARRSASRRSHEAPNDEYRIVRSMAKGHQVNAQLRSLMPEPAATPQAAASTSANSRFAPMTTPPSRLAPPPIAFDHLIHLDSRMLAQLLAVADPTVLALALAGSSDELVERICDQMPKRIAKTFRRELRRMGPTRLSDVGDAQRAIAEIVAQHIADRRNGMAGFAHKASVA
jgi:CelD/BcsL family acetyltransferase involved in cellulose biosynthesis